MMAEPRAEPSSSLRDLHRHLLAAATENLALMRLWAWWVPSAGHLIDKLNAAYLSYLHMRNADDLLALCRHSHIPVPGRPADLFRQFDVSGLVAQLQQCATARDMATEAAVVCGAQLAEMQMQQAHLQLLFDARAVETLGLIAARHRDAIGPGLAAARDGLRAEALA